MTSEALRRRDDVALFSYEQVLAVEGIDRATLYRRIARREYSTVTVLGGRGKMIPLWCLSAEGQQTVASRQQTETTEGRAAGPPAQREAGPAPLPACPPPIPTTSDGRPDLAAMREVGQGRLAAEYERRIGAVSELEAALQSTPHGKRGAVWARMAREHGVCPRTLRNWTKALKCEGPMALVPDWGLTQKNVFDAIPRALQLKILEFYTDYRRPTAAQVWRHVVRVWCEAEGIEPPAKCTIRRFLQRSVRPIERSAFRRGPRHFQANFAAKVERDIASLETNEIWCADHRLLDTMVLATRSQNEVRAVRPWLTMIIDVRTAGIVGYRLCERPSSVSVSHALRSAILTVGVPQAFYRDNGKEFTARRFGGKPVRLRRPRGSDVGEATRWPAALPGEVEQGLWAALGIRLVTALPYRAWSKPIESIFGAFSRLFENLLPGWTGRDAQDKPEVLAKHIAQGNLLTWEQFEDLFARLVAEWNTDHICGERSETPAQAYERHTPHVPEARVLDLLLQDRRREKVRPRGIKLQGRLYQSEELGILVGETVTVRWDPGEPGWIVVYTRHGQVLAVPEIPKADYQGFGPANEIAQRVERAQRAYLTARRAELRGHLTPEELDPLGGFRAVAERKQAERAETRAERLEVEAGAIEAERQLEARERAEKERPENPLRAMGKRLQKEREERRQIAS